MSKNIITISREFGSGGRTVGRMVAEKLGYDFYDQELIAKVMLESGLSEELVRKYDEYATHRSSLLFAIALSGGTDPYTGTGHSFATQVQAAQTKAINDLADKGGCVIVGRGADYVLRDRENALHVFIYADMDFRAKRIVEEYGERDEKPVERLKDKDERRKLYYRSFTSRNWGDYKNYDLSLSTSAVGIEKCADIIVDIAKK